MLSGKIHLEDVTGVDGQRYTCEVVVDVEADYGPPEPDVGWNGGWTVHGVSIFSGVAWDEDGNEHHVDVLDEEEVEDRIERMYDMGVLELY